MLQLLSRSVGPKQKHSQPNAAGKALAWSEFQKPSSTE